ncbi:MAG: ABC transporter substrate-binding protein [Alphaproteobacteria bacterium]|nr:ABC transporter substrate-binding protein [Alphaproteobacteria bacterium]
MEIPEGPARTQGIVSNQIDIDVGPSLDHMAQVERAGGKSFIYAAPRTIGLTIVSMRNKQPVTTPWGDVRVRQAPNYAVNKRAIVDGIYAGRGVVASQSATSKSFGYDPTIQPYAYNPTKAKQLLTEAGFPNGFDTEVRTTNTDPTFVQIWEAAVKDLNAAGIRAKYLPQTFAEFLKYWTGGDWPHDLFGLGHDLSGELDVAQVFASYTSCLKDPPYYCNQAELPLIQAQAQEFDPKKRQEILSRLLRMNAENAPIVYLTEGIEVITHSAKIKNFKAVNLAINYYEMEIGR